MDRETLANARCSCGHSWLSHGPEMGCAHARYPAGLPHYCPCPKGRVDALLPLIDAEVAAARAEGVLEALLDLEGDVGVRRDDPEGYAGTFMQAVHGGDTGRAEDWAEAWRWSDKFTQRAALDAPAASDTNPRTEPHG